MLKCNLSYFAKDEKRWKINISKGGSDYKLFLQYKTDLSILISLIYRVLIYLKQNNNSKVRVEVGVSNTFLIDNNKAKMILCLLVRYRLYQNKWQYSLFCLAERIPWSMNPLCKIKDILNIIVQRVIEIWMKLHNLQSGKNTLIVD